MLYIQHLSFVYYGSYLVLINILQCRSKISKVSQLFQLPLILLILCYLGHSVGRQQLFIKDGK